ncbi:MAG: sigma-70 family RNA polymerase sigma factor, partial [Sedimentisphaerales bacterium]|nr:sigma-70 family RNA polymerase sigma factor [Sedimentisphaerales bacterium]
MSDLESYIELVRKAQQGGKDATDRLAEIASLRLREYALRLTFDKDLTEDIVQESMLEMLRVFDKLKKAEQFWSWLYGIAYNKVRTHRRDQSRHKAASLSAVGAGIADEGKREVFAESVGGELKQIVLKAMAELKPQQRDVLTMRCYDRMPYEQIAELMGCSKFAAQALFYRAKKSLAKGLSRHGLGKGYLLAALVLFGKVTASSEAAAADITVTAATLKIGTAASLVAVATSKTAIVTMTAAAVITAGSLVIEPKTVESHDGQIKPDVDSTLAIQPKPAKSAEESW